MMEDTKTHKELFKNLLSNTKYNSIVDEIMELYNLAQKVKEE